MRFPTFHRKSPGDGDASHNDLDSQKENKSSLNSDPSTLDSSSDSDSEKVQFGVQQAQAVAAAWSKKALVFAYLGIFMVFFTCSLQQQVTGALTPYVTSAFAKHSLIATTSIMSSIIGAVSKLPVAKIIDIWGRAEGYMLMVMFCVIGLVMMASCTGVETYAAAQVFYWIGYNGISYVLDVFLADTSSLRNRGWIFAFSTSPYIATAFAGPAAAQQFYRHYGWRWAFGTFSIVAPVVSIPLVYIFYRSRRKAQELGYLKKQPSGRTFWESVKYYTVQFDVLGMILCIAGFSLILLPLNIISFAPAMRTSPLVITMFVIGFSSMIGFWTWERWGAPVRFAPFHLLTDPMVLGGCGLSAILFCSFYCWDLFFVSYLQVVQGLDIRTAGYVGNIFSIDSDLLKNQTSFIRYYGKFKYVALIALPFQMVGIGLMVKFRQPGTDLWLVIMCQVLIAASGGTLTICEQMAVMAAANTSEIAIVLALLGLFSSIGGAIGQTIAGTIWMNTFPKQLGILLPEVSKAKVAEIFSSLSVQLSYPMGSMERDAIIRVYGIGQERMLWVALGLLFLGIPCILAWKNVDLKKVKKNQGTAV
ncbi:hypothetical protein FQN55_007130 [Onygenales sp. PD_40]|nr:hypothetical protein FQN55_007130 [Onygenales sp. PD_40]KAK2782513.1 hypothetical protein FQN52_000841 [Onygenales sp. PD_12]